MNVFRPGLVALRLQCTQLMVLAGIAAGLLSSQVSAAAPAPEIRLIPKTALAVAQLHGHQHTRERFLAMVQAAMPDLTPRARTAMTRAIEKIMDGRDLAALRPDGRILIVVTNLEDLGSDTPPIVVLLPVRSYQDFRAKMLTKEEQASFRPGTEKIDRFEAHGVTHYAIHFPDQGNYLAITEHEESAVLMAGKFEPLALGNPADAVATTFLRADLSIYVHLAAINDRYGNQIQNIRQILNFAIRQAATAQVGIDERQQEQARLLFDGLFQCLHDGIAMSAGLRFLPNGLQTELQVSFAPKSVAATLLGKQHPCEARRLADLPQGQLSYAASCLSPAISRLMTALGPEYRAADGDSNTEERIEKYHEQLEQAREIIQASHGVDRQIRILTVAEPEKLVQTQLALYEHLPAGAEYANVKLKTKATVTRDAQKAAGFTLHEARWQLDFAAMVQGITDDNLRDTTIASMKRFVPEKPRLWFGSDGKHVVQIMAPDWDTAKDLLTRWNEKSTRAGELLSFQKTVEQLPNDANLIVLNDVGGSLKYLNDVIVELLETVPGLPIREIPKLGNVPKEPAFVGTAIRFSPAGLGMTLILPTEAMKTARTVLQPIFEGFAAAE